MAADDEVLRLIEVLEQRLQKDGGDPFVWAKERLADPNQGSFVDDARYELSLILGRWNLLGRPLPSHLSRLVRALLPFDMAYTLTFPKDHLDYPNGIMWVTEEDFKRLEATPGWKTRSLGWSIRSAYTKCLPLLNQEDAAYVERMLQPKQPKWMDVVFGPL